MRELTDDENNFLYHFVDLKLPMSTISEIFGQRQVQAWLTDPSMRRAIAERQKEAAEKLWLKKKIEVEQILDLRPKALEVIKRVLSDKDHPDQVKVAMKVLGGEMSMLEAMGKAIGEKKASEASDKKDIKLVYERDQDKTS